MNVGLVYFSQTGNTQKVAEAISETLAGRLGQCALLQLEQTDPSALDRYLLLGLGCPAFYFREPLNVERFIQEMPAPSPRPKPIFFFVTHGGTPGAILWRLKRLARERNLFTLGLFSCLGVDSFPPFADLNPPIAFGHPDDRDLASARSFAEEMAVRASAYYRGERLKEKAFEGSPAAPLLSFLFSRRHLQSLERCGLLPGKRVDPGRCLRCRLCLEACPQGIISMPEYPVISKEGCIYCYHCYHICPQQAIFCNWGPLRFFSGHYLRKFLASITKKSRRHR